MQDSESLNLDRWRQSGFPEQWVRQRHAQWNHHEWLRLLDDLLASPYWPMRPDDIGSVLEYFKQKFGRAAATPNAATANALPTVQRPLPDIKRANAGLSKGLSLLALCVAVLVFVAKYVKGSRGKNQKLKTGVFGKV